MERVNEFLSANKLPLVLSLVGVVLIIGGIFASGIHLPNLSTSKASPSAKPKSSSFSPGSIVKTDDLTEIKVDVSGAINKPGVYALSTDSRIEDAIKVAGGFSQNVNKSFISKSLNLSQKISDGLKIYIPFQGEQGVVLAAQTSVGSSGSSATGKVGINSGSVAQLNSLPGVGDVTSQKIIKARPFATIDELVTKKAVSRSVLEKIKDLIDLS